MPTITLHIEAYDLVDVVDEPKPVDELAEEIRGVILDQFEDDVFDVTVQTEL
jgi:hypothetical protein